MAEVNAPVSWPKSSLSISSEGIAAQLTSMYGMELLALCSWRLRATSSFPEPFGPTISTLASVGATFAMMSFTWRTGSDSPIIFCP